MAYSRNLLRTPPGAGARYVWLKLLVYETLSYAQGLKLLGYEALRY